MLTVYSNILLLLIYIDDADRYLAFHVTYHIGLVFVNTNNHFSEIINTL